ncbi:MAG TPA: hypothetical protein VJY39_16980 [Acidisphaera sp.]|nr:hypothetical protein [Acidisphaera sp.]
MSDLELAFVWRPDGAPEDDQLRPPSAVFLRARLSPRPSDPDAEHTEAEHTADE